MNNTQRVDHLVAGRATGGDAVETAKGIERRVPFFQLGLPISGVAPLAPGVKAQFLFDITQMVGYYINTAQMVLQQVLGFLAKELITLIANCLKRNAQLTFVLSIIVCCKLKGSVPF